MSMHCLLFMYTLFNFEAANSLMEQLLLFFSFDLYRSSDFGFVFLALGDKSHQFISCLFLNNYLKSKDLISDKNNVQNVGPAKVEAS